MSCAAGKTSPHFASTFNEIKWSALVLPILTSAIGFCSSLIFVTILKLDWTANDEPHTTSASHWSISSFTAWTRSRGTFSPKKTMSGFNIPPQSGQSGTVNRLQSSCKKISENWQFWGPFASPATKMVHEWSVGDDPRLVWIWLARYNPNYTLIVPRKWRNNPFFTSIVVEQMKVWLW